MGRPSMKTPELVKAICERLCKGEPLTQICRDPGMPNPSTVWDWQQADPEVSQAIAHARDIGADAIAEQALVIADTPPAYKTTEGGTSIDQGDVQNRKLQIETRLKLLAKWNPKKYGDKQQVEHSGGVTLESLVAGSDPADKG